MSDTVLNTVYEAYLKVKNCPACAGRRRRLKERLDKLLKKFNLTEDELVQKMEDK